MNSHGFTGQNEYAGDIKWSPDKLGSPSPLSAKLGVVVEEEVNIENLIADFPYTPFGQRVFAYELNVKSVGGIFIPETVRADGQMRTNEGIVVAIGREVTFCKPKDTILYGRFSGAWQEINGKRFRMMNEEDIIALKKEI